MLGFLLALLGGTLGLAGLGGGGGDKAPSIVTPKDGGGTSGPADTPRDPTDDMPDDDMDDMPDDSSGGGMDDMPDDHGGGDHGGGMDDMPDDDHGDHGGGSTGDPADTPKDDGSGVEDPKDHDGHGSDVKLPVTAAEIDAFVTMVRTAEEPHAHGHGDDRAGEHMQAMDLVNPADATHIAIGHGSWFDPSNWHNGEVPGDDAKVVIPNGVHIEYDQESDARLFTVRVDGQLDFATDTDSTMVVDTMIVSPNGTLTAGTADDPVEDGVNVEIIIANNGAIDTNWDPGLFSRGIISHGKTEIHGQEKDSHEKVIEDPMIGDKSVTFAELPAGWQVGDTIVIAGTRYEGHTQNKQTGEWETNPPEDEVRVISEIRGDTVYFDEPLIHDHDAPRADLKTSVANYSRNVTIKSEDGADSEIFARGHVMLMHSDDVDVRYAAFEELGRTDKSKDLEEADGFDSNVAGRYGLHLHRTGVEDLDNPTQLVGNAVMGSPGWGIVQHDSNAIIDNNATYDTFGAGFVAESGNETGMWSNNIAIFAEGRSWSALKGATDISNFDTALTGDGFWFQGRMVGSENNIAASVNHGFAYFHRGSDPDGNSTYDSELFQFADALNYADDATAATTPILSFKDNEAFAARQGLHVVKASPNQGNDIHSVFDGFTAWNVSSGAHFQYTSHYTLIDFDLIGNGDTSMKNSEGGITFGKNVYDFTIVNPSADSFYAGAELQKGFSANLGDTDPSMHNYVVINPNFTNVTFDFDKFDPSLDTIIDGSVNPGNVSLTLDGPLVYTNGGRLEISGTKTDSLGQTDYPSEPDNFDLKSEDVKNILSHDGYYIADDGHRYFTHNMYLSDRVTGDIYKQVALVRIDDDVILGLEGKYFSDAKLKGQVTLDELQGQVNAAAELVLSFTGMQHGMHSLSGGEDHASSEALWDALTQHSGVVEEHQEQSSHHSTHMMEDEAA